VISINDVIALSEKIKNAPQFAGAEGAATVAGLIDEARVVYGKWLNVTRARILADEHYLNGASQRTLASTQGVSVNAVSLWLKQYGPTEYVTVRQEAEAFVIETVKPRAVRDLIGAGRRVAPSTWGLFDNDLGLIYTGKPERLWNNLASQA